MLQHLVQRTTIRQGVIEIAIRPASIAALPGSAGSRQHSNEPERDDDQACLVLTVPARLKRCGSETKLLIEAFGRKARQEPDRSMLGLLVRPSASMP